MCSNIKKNRTPFSQSFGWNLFKTYSGDRKDKEIIKNIIISTHLNFLKNHAWVAAENTKIPIKEVTITNIACQKLSTPIKSSSWLKRKTIGKTPVLKLYHIACIPVFNGSPPEIPAAAYEASPTGGVTSAIKPK